MEPSNEDYSDIDPELVNEINDAAKDTETLEGITAQTLHAELEDFTHPDLAKVHAIIKADYPELWQQIERIYTDFNQPVGEQTLDILVALQASQLNADEVLQQTLMKQFELLSVVDLMALAADKRTEKAEAIDEIEVAEYLSVKEKTALLNVVDKS